MVLLQLIKDGGVEISNGREKALSKKRVTSVGKYTTNFLEPSTFNILNTYDIDTKYTILVFLKFFSISLNSNINYYSTYKTVPEHLACGSLIW